MNSRLYRFIFSVNTAADIPSDFLASVQDRPFETGVFLPQDDKKWFTEAPEYPARLLLLYDRRLSIVPHPTSDELSVDFDLDDLFQLETGNSLLRGWIRFKTGSTSSHLVYNTRASWRLDSFIATLRRRWLGCFFRAGTVVSHESQMFGREPDIKFRNMLQDALDPNEIVLSQYFVAPFEKRHDALFFRRADWFPGHLLALTSSNRLLWLTDEYGGHWARYAGISISVPLCLLRRAVVERCREESILILDFLHDLSWRISVCDSGNDCAAFLHILDRHCSSEALDLLQFTGH